MPLPERLLKGRKCDYSIGQLVEMTPENATVPEERLLMGLVLPPWQRPEVWTAEQKIKFVEGIFLGLGCGFYVTNGFDYLNDGTSAPMSGWLIDGQQRLCAIRDFINGDITLFDDVKYAELEKREQLRFMREGFPCFQLDYTSDENVLKELYDRLNFGGTAHKPEERVKPDEDSIKPRFKKP